MNHNINMFNLGSKRMSIFFLLGAGASADSNLFTYRGVNGLYSNNLNAQDPEKLLSIHSWNKNRNKVWDVLRPQFDILSKATPGPTYKKISEITKMYPQSFILTQNVDGLVKQVVGNNIPIVEMHGNWSNIICNSCNYETTYFDSCDKCKMCNNGIYRPDIVFFCERLPDKKLTSIYTLLKRRPSYICVIGTSMQFQYLRILINKVKGRGTKVIHINPDPNYLSNINRNEIWIKKDSNDGLDEFIKILNIDNNS